MAQWINIPTHTDERGSLSVLEKTLPFDIQRIYYIYGAKQQRGGHAHKKTQQAFICLGGSCEITIHTTKEQKTYLLNSPQKCLLLEPHEWHTMQNFSSEAFLLVLASEHYNPDDYIMDIPND